MRILVVEDEAKLAQAIKRSLETQHYAVDIVHDGQTGLDMALAENFDVIMLDIMLPGISGIEICKQIRADGITTPILMLTAKGQIQDKVTGLDVGSDEYMVKPFSMQELFARIRALVRRSAHQIETTFSSGDLKLDPTTLMVTKGQKIIELSAKEFAILEYLLRHKNKVLSREQIVNHVWDYDADILQSTVEVHIKHLRDKIDTPFNTQLIKTVRGFGYQIREE